MNQFFLKNSRSSIQVKRKFNKCYNFSKILNYIIGFCFLIIFCLIIIYESFETVIHPINSPDSILELKIIGPKRVFLTINHEFTSFELSYNFHVLDKPEQKIFFLEYQLIANKIIAVGSHYLTNGEKRLQAVNTSVFVENEIDGRIYLTVNNIKILNIFGSKIHCFIRIAYQVLFWRGKISSVLYIFFRNLA